MSQSTSNSSNDMTLFEALPDIYFSAGTLRRHLPTVELALFFAKVYQLDYTKLGQLLRMLFNTPVVQALTEGSHSVELQDYLVETVPTEILAEMQQFTSEPMPSSEVLVQLWKSLEVEVAKSIQEVANKLAGTLHLLPSKEGDMLFASMAKINRLRPTVGVYGAHIRHAPVPEVLVVLDVSGSMTEETIEAIIGDVVAMSYNANASLAVVSNSAFLWAPGGYSVKDVLAKAEYGGTHYEQLKPLFDQSWGTVITIADYDSSPSAMKTLANCKGHIGQVLDISLVSRTTFLAECVGQLADEVRPLMLAQGIINW